MKKINLRLFLIAVCAGVFLSMAVSDAFARSRGFSGFGGGRSFSSNRSFGKTNYNWGKSGRKTGLSGSTRKSSAGRMSSADRSLYNRAKTSGTAFSSKSDALKSFKSKSASKYPTKFSSQPSVRPSYVPQNITLKGKQHKISYRNGGYGYYIGSTWLLYSVLNDDHKTEKLMAENGYYYGPRPGLSFMSILGMGITLFLLMNMLKSVASKGTTRQFKTFK
jgi:hypothetical protein